MHQTRQETTTRLPITRKGTKYIARPLSDLDDSVSVVMAVRDMLGLAKNSNEVNKMIAQKVLKINGKEVKDRRESVKLFNILEAGKTYVLKLSPTRKFFFEETKDKERLCKVVGKKLLRNKKVQLNLHDGSNIVSDNKIKIGDSIYLDLSGKIKKHVSLEKGKEVFVICGRYEGKMAKIESIEGKEITIKLKDRKSTINLSNIIVL